MTQDLLPLVRATLNDLGVVSNDRLTVTITEAWKADSATLPGTYFLILCFSDAKRIQ